MARTAIAVTKAQRGGVEMLAAVPADVTNGNSMVNDGATGLIVRNTGAVDAHTITFHLFRTVDGQPVTPRTEAVPVGDVYLFGPFPVADYGSTLAFNGDHAELTFQAVRI
ncbi:hypothetical protein [Allostreptomyces psammosilenae]|uniref:Uncharacterized protein n=1 Tax=Allostreptomyces psammosilenae TaxID=1892865 RepID=A0A853A694_9ACTN|nr:hypothetical protein [Allostreptomyces psammosilenae]NYI06058.1 hypothetical protein [Allostreptomyces psammosilenae]